MFTPSPPVRTISPADSMMMTPSEVNKQISTNGLESDNHTFGTPEADRSILPTTHLKVDKPRSTKHSEKQNQNRTGLKSEKLLPHDDTQSVPSESQVSTERPAKKLSLENTNPS